MDSHQQEGELWTLGVLPFLHVITTEQGLASPSLHIFVKGLH